MARGSKSKYTAQQKREAQHIEEGYEKRGVSEKEAKKRAWATVNKMHGGGAKGGSGTEAIQDIFPAKKGRHKQAANRSAEERSASAKKAAHTRKIRQNSLSQ